MQYSQKSI